MAGRGLLRDAGVRAFLLVWSGQVVSLLGSGLTAFALGVWIYQQTASTTQYGLVTFCAAFPPLVVLPLSGPIIDRWDRKRLLIACEIVGASASGGIAILAGLGALSLVWACVIATVTSAASAVQGVAQTTTVTLLVPREHFGRASGLSQLGYAASQIVAPALAGVLLPLVGLLGIATIDAATFLVAIATIASAAIPRHAGSGHERRSYGEDLRFGWTYIFGRPGLAALLVMFAFTNFFSDMAAILFTPLVLTFAAPAALGSILAAGGVGMVAGGALMGLWGGPRRPALGAALLAAASGAIVATAGFSTMVPVLSGIVFVFFFVQPLIMGSSQVLWQRSVPAAVQGRVFTARATVAMSAGPLASLVAGPLADRLFEPAMAVGGSLSGTLGQMIGVGRGRGIALILVAAGLSSAVSALVAASYGPLRRLDEAAAAPPTPQPAGVPG